MLYSNSARFLELANLFYEKYMNSDHELLEGRPELPVQCTVVFSRCDQVLPGDPDAIRNSPCGDVVVRVPGAEAAVVGAASVPRAPSPGIGIY